MKGLFVTSSGTGIGKTLVTASLMYQMRVHYQQAMALKPVISGMEDGIEASDTAVLAAAMGRGLSPATIDTISPYRYQASLSPAMAAQLEGKTLDYAALIATCREALAAFPFTLIEGVGGSFVPLTDDKLVADWIADLGLASVLVVGSYLGAQSHALATFEAMQARGLTVSHIIVSTSDDAGAPSAEVTRETLERFTGMPTLLLPRLTGPKPWTTAPDLTAVWKPHAAR